MIDVGDGGLSQKTLIKFDVSFEGLRAAGIDVSSFLEQRKPEQPLAPMTPPDSVQVYDGGLEKIGPGRERLREALEKLPLIPQQHGAIGMLAGADVTTGHQNVAIGWRAGEMAVLSSSPADLSAKLFDE